MFDELNIGYDIIFKPCENSIMPLFCSLKTVPRRNSDFIGRLLSCDKQHYLVFPGVELIAVLKKELVSGFQARCGAILDDRTSSWRRAQLLDLR